MSAREAIESDEAFTPTVAWAKERIAAWRAELSPETPNPNEEDSPGNYVVREIPGGVEFVWYDGDGAEDITELSRCDGIAMSLVRLGGSSCCA